MGTLDRPFGRDWSAAALKAVEAAAVVVSYLLLITLALVCLALALYFVVALVKSRNYLIVILVPPFALAGLTILRSLIPRKLELPGVRVDPTQEPRLMAEIGSAAAALNVALPAEVYLITDATAYVIQRGGFMGFGGDTILMLGVPIMAALSVSEFRAIVAHEFAHFYTGDTHLRPWLWDTLRSLLQVDKNLNREASNHLLSFPYKMLLSALNLYRSGFLDLILVISRHREFRSDEIACHLAGSEEFAQALYKLHKAGAVAPRYWKNIVLPLVCAGYQPRLAADFLIFQAAESIEHVASTALEEQLKITRPDPFHPDPPLAARLKRIRSLGLPGTQSDNHPAFYLFDNLGTWETSLIRKAAPQLANTNLKPVNWETAATEIYLPTWRKNIERFHSLIPRKTLSSLPECLRDLEPIADKVLGRSMLRSDRQERAADILGCAVWIALVDHGWELVIRPGCYYVKREGEKVALSPDGAVTRLRSGALSAGDWQALCADTAIGDIPFGQKDRVEPIDAADETRLYPPDHPQESEYLYSRSAIHRVSLYEAALQMFE